MNIKDKEYLKEKIVALMQDSHGEYWSKFPNEDVTNVNEEESNFISDLDRRTADKIISLFEND